MSSYDLHCFDCGRDFELFVQGFLKDWHKVCPDCSSRNVAQRVTGGFMHSSGSSGENKHSCGPTYG